MPHDEKGAFSADIPEDAIADALAAVEKREGGESPAAEVAVEEVPSLGPSPEGGEAELLRRELELSQTHARKVFEQLKEEHDKLLRVAADHENYKKRAAREREEVQRYGHERLVKEILPALDALDRALRLVPPGEPLASGVELTRRLLEEGLARFGVKGFSAKGQPFDPRVHEALMTFATSELKPGMVVEEQSRGFFLHERLIRPAAVVVSAALPAGASAPAGEAAGPAEGAPGDLKAP
ncbi:MAG TPA: nucleotide exchange factor GrpE [Anaeromyxobacteraceae bacterium]|nr:nucleotide exchange factor GrpE [Anaeromyxobacteraceae bacterium]